ncbi:hypothetical protein M011DRAFT_258210 [Sporormia fimetaria CBS 119925]|uniref:Uncharacterized protein n=1 Tax=Sporormia fimetaria CBS 119925 TaxID=1340428 RepID=A0A6A6V0S7_9PLEO|nr:hypothetical protein M011DRAFT_258210 [Sporormia fimetaria CBS 119925]
MITPASYQTPTLRVALPSTTPDTPLTPNPEHPLTTHLSHLRVLSERIKSTINTHLAYPHPEHLRRLTALAREYNTSVSEFREGWIREGYAITFMPDLIDAGELWLTKDYNANSTGDKARGTGRGMWWDGKGIGRGVKKQDAEIMECLRYMGWERDYRAKGKRGSEEMDMGTESEGETVWAPRVKQVKKPTEQKAQKEKGVGWKDQRNGNGGFASAWMKGPSAQTARKDVRPESGLKTNGHQRGFVRPAPTSARSTGKSTTAPPQAQGTPLFRRPLLPPLQTIKPPAQTNHGFSRPVPQNHLNYQLSQLPQLRLPQLPQPRNTPTQHQTNPHTPQTPQSPYTPYTPPPLFQSSQFYQKRQSILPRMMVPDDDDEEDSFRSPIGELSPLNEASKHRIRAWKWKGAWKAPGYGDSLIDALSPTAPETGVLNPPFRSTTNRGHVCT